VGLAKANPINSSSTFLQIFIKSFHFPASNSPLLLPSSITAPSNFTLRRMSKQTPTLKIQVFLSKLSYFLVLADDGLGFYG